MVSTNYDFFDASVEDLIRGYRTRGESGDCVCLICEEAFENGKVHSFGQEYLLAGAAAGRHCAERHGGMLRVLLDMDKRYTGLSDSQKRILECFRQGLEDAEIAKELDIGLSTIRSYRFAFREKAKAAKVFLALTRLVEEGARGKGNLVPIHRTAIQVDERYAITEEEESVLVAEYFSGEGPLLKLKSFPKGEKKKIVILRKLAGLFKPDCRFTEKEVNETLFRIYPDTATLRRYLVEYGFLDREPGGFAYWVKR
jgi:hypothetical protein